MAPDAIELLLNLFYRHVHIVQMTLFVSFILLWIWSKDFVVIEVFNWRRSQHAIVDLRMQGA